MLLARGVRSVKKRRPHYSSRVEAGLVSIIARVGHDASGDVNEYYAARWLIEMTEWRRELVARNRLRKEARKNGTANQDERPCYGCAPHLG